MTYPSDLTPGQGFAFALTVTVRSPYQLTDARGDFLSSLAEDDAALCGAYHIIPVIGTVDPGQTFCFDNYDTPLIAPALPAGSDQEEFASEWRVWMHTRYAGPKLRILFTVREP